MRRISQPCADRGGEGAPDFTVNLPATGATAAKRSPSRQPSMLAKKPPFDMPVAKMRSGSTHSMLDTSSASARTMMSLPPPGGNGTTMVTGRDGHACAPAAPGSSAASCSFSSRSASPSASVTISPGVYMDAAYIRNLNALVARLGTAVIDDAKIASLSVAKITAGSLAVGQYIESVGYTAGPSGVGYRLTRTSIELPSTAIRGLLTASQMASASL